MKNFVQSGNPIKDAATLNESRLSLMNGSMGDRSKSSGKDLGKKLEANVNEGNGSELRYLISPNHFGDEGKDAIVESLKRKETSNKGFQEQEKLLTNQGPEVFVKEHRDTIRSRSSVRLSRNHSMFKLEQGDRSNQRIVRDIIDLGR
jgi:hypothetical protein